MLSIKNTKNDDCKQLLRMSSFDSRESLSQSNSASVSLNNETPLNMPDKGQSLFNDVGIVLEDTINKLSTTKSSNTSTSTDPKQKKSFFLRYIHLPKFNSRVVSSHCLRIMFLLFISLIALLSFAIFLIVGYNAIQFKQQCLLYSTFDYEIIGDIKTNYTVRLNSAKTVFGSKSACEFCTYYCVAVFIYCIVTCFFFVLFNADNRIILTSDKTLLIPWLIISIILGILSLVNGCVLTNGFKMFCTSIINNLKYNQSQYCSQINLMYFEQYPTVKYVYTYMIIAIVFAWCQLLFFIGSIGILILRLSTSELDNDIDYVMDDEMKSKVFQKNIENLVSIEQQQSNDVNDIMLIEK